jgi:hypothetical protein
MEHVSRHSCRTAGPPRPRPPRLRPPGRAGRRWVRGPATPRRRQEGGSRARPARAGPASAAAAGTVTRTSGCTGTAVRPGPGPGPGGLRVVPRRGGRPPPLPPTMTGLIDAPAAPPGGHPAGLPGGCACHRDCSGAGLALSLCD